VEVEVRMARLVEAFGRVRRGGMSRLAAAAMLGISERHFRRLYDSCEEGGPDAIVDRRRGRPASNTAPPDCQSAYRFDRIASSKLLPKIVRR